MKKINVIQNFLPEVEKYKTREAFEAACMASPLLSDRAGDDAVMLAIGDLYDAANRSYKEIVQTLETSNRALCLKYGIPYSTVCDWIQGKRTPPKYILLMIQICEGLIVSEI